MAAKKKTKKKAKSYGSCTPAQAGRILGKMSAAIKKASRQLSKRK